MLPESTSKQLPKLTEVRVILMNGLVILETPEGSYLKGYKCVGVSDLRIEVKKNED